MLNQWTPLALEENLVQSEQTVNQPEQYLTFYLGEEIFAINIFDVREIIEYNALTWVPMTPPLIRGVINLRGSVVPVIDLSVRLGRTPNPLTERTCIVILQTSFQELNIEECVAQKIGIIVDAVSEVVDILPEQISPPLELGSRIRIDFIRGMGKINGKFVVLLNLSRVLLRKEITVLFSPNRKKFT